jgi:hypothetical protein
MARSTPPLPSISGKPRPVPVLARERFAAEDDDEVLALRPLVCEDWLDMEDMRDMLDMEDEAWATATAAPAAAGAFGAAEALPPTSTNIAPIENSVATRQVAIFGTVRAPKVLDLRPFLTHSTEKHRIPAPALLCALTLAHHVGRAK